MSNSTKKISLMAFVLVLALVLTACGTQAPAPTESTPVETEAATEVVSTETVVPEETEATTQEAATSEVSFTADVLPILESRCLQCHGGQRTEAGLTISSYASLMAGAEDGTVIIPGDSANSPLYDLAASGKMPKRGAKLTPAQLEIIAAWINAGALDN